MASLAASRVKMLGCQWPFLAKREQFWIKKKLIKHSALQQSFTVAEHCGRSLVHLKVFGGTLSVETNLMFKTKIRELVITV